MLCISDKFQGVWMTKFFRMSVFYRALNSPRCFLDFAYQNINSILLYILDSSYCRGSFAGHMSFVNLQLGLHNIRIRIANMQMTDTTILCDNGSLESSSTLGYSFDVSFDRLFKPVRLCKRTGTTDLPVKFATKGIDAGQKSTKK